jgi:tRNA A37 threonylcarbamoyladenosine dehydratase
MSDFDFRFGGIQRLFSAKALERLRSAHVCVVGIGGVGSWTVEALARSGVGELTLVDMDEVCVSNINRQLHALDGVIGRSKVEVMSQRVTAINPECRVHAIGEFLLPSTAESILRPRFDFVVDAIDNVPNKCLLIAQCRDKGHPIITLGGAGGRRNPLSIQLADLALTTHDGLLQQVRKRLRDEHGFPRELKKPFGVPCVYSTEPQVYPQTDGTVCDRREPGSDLRLNCNNGYGTAAFVTGAFGFAAAAHVVSAIAASATSAGSVNSAGAHPPGDTAK